MVEEPLLTLSSYKYKINIDCRTEIILEKTFDAYT